MLRLESSPLKQKKKKKAGGVDDVGRGKSKPELKSSPLGRCCEVKKGSRALKAVVKWTTIVTAGEKCLC